MADLLDSAMAYHAAALKGNRGTAVFYQRGAESVAITATIGSTDFERQDGDGTQIAFKSFDILVTAADLVLNGTTILPRNGDKVVRVAGSYRRTFEVLALDGEPQYAWMDGSGLQLRIHTKLIREEPA